MKISSKSWHYKLIDFMDGDIGRKIAKGQVTTCSYIWAIIKSIFQALFAIFVACIALFILGLLAGSAVLLPIALYFGVPVVEHVVVFATITYGAGLVGLITWLYETKIKDWSGQRREKKLSLLRQRMLDGKEGICTILEVE